MRPPHAEGRGTPTTRAARRSAGSVDQEWNIGRISASRSSGRARARTTRGFHRTAMLQTRPSNATRRRSVRALRRREWEAIAPLQLHFQWDPPTQPEAGASYPCHQHLPSKSVSTVTVTAAAGIGPCCRPVSPHHFRRPCLLSLCLRAPLQSVGPHAFGGRPNLGLHSLSLTCPQPDVSG